MALKLLYIQANSPWQQWRKTRAFQTQRAWFAPGTMTSEDHNSEVGKETDAGCAGPHTHANKGELCVENRMCDFCICIYIWGAASQVWSQLVIKAHWRVTGVTNTIWVVVLPPPHYLSTRLRWVVNSMEEYAKPDSPDVGGLWLAYRRALGQIIENHFAKANSQCPSYMKHGEIGYCNCFDDRSRDRGQIDPQYHSELH